MDVEMRLLTLKLGDRDFEAALTVPKDSNPEYAVILTHGAGGSLESGELPNLAEHLAKHGFEELQSFDFNLKGIFVGGRSMGARAAVGVANQCKGTQLSTLIKGIICLSYPLIGGVKGDVRDQPLFEITHPILFISGDKDLMCPADKLEATLRKMTNTVHLHWVPSVGHQFVTKTHKEGEITETINHQVEQWCTGLKDPITDPTSKLKLKTNKRKANHEKVEDSETPLKSSKPAVRMTKTSKGKSKRKKLARSCLSDLTQDGK